MFFVAQRGAAFGVNTLDNIIIEPCGPTRGRRFTMKLIKPFTPKAILDQSKRQDTAANEVPTCGGQGGHAEVDRGAKYQTSVVPNTGVDTDNVSAKANLDAAITAESTGQIDIANGRVTATAPSRTSAPAHVAATPLTSPQKSLRPPRGSVPPPTPATRTVQWRSGAHPVLIVGNPGNPVEWVDQHRDALRATAAEDGWVLIRGLGLADSLEVGTVFALLGGPLMADREPFATRHAYAEGVYSASQWAAHRPMGMHHELSYGAEAPSLLLFACLQPASVGGATGVADSSSVLDGLPSELVSRFARRGWRLTRNYYDDFGPSIADTFGSDDPRFVEAYCRANAIELAWQPNGGLRTWQQRDAIITHPVTGVRCWFNQIAFLNEWALDPEVREFLLDTKGTDGLPVNTSYGDGEPIDPDIIELINRTYDIHTVFEPWHAGDLMLVDNIRTAHNREPFHGQREILIAMTDPLATNAITSNLPASPQMPT